MVPDSPVDLQCLEKVLVQNILFGLSPSLTDAIKSISRWKLIQTAFPYVIHCAASLLHNRWVPVRILLLRSYHVPFC